MWKRFVSWLRSTRLVAWFRANPLKATVGACLACVAGAATLGALTPSTFLRDVAADFIGGVVAALVIFGVAEVAFGFTQTRKRQREALEIAIVVVGVELAHNKSELERIMQVLREGRLNQFDPVFQAEMGPQTQSWELFIQSPVAEHLPTQLVWRIHQAYYLPARTQRLLRQRLRAVMAASPQWWIDLGLEFLPKFEADANLVQQTLTALDDAVRRL